MPSQPEGILIRHFAMLAGIDTNTSAKIDRAGCSLVEEVLRGARSARVRVHGSSMIPAIWPGDVIAIEPADAASIKVNEIAVFTRKGRLFAHRVIQVGATGLTTRGDSLSQSDAPVARSEILGRVTLVMRRHRRVPVDRASAATKSIVSSAIRNSNLLRRVVVGLHSRLCRARFAIGKALA